MLARDWYYNQRRKIGLDSAVASLYDGHDDSDLRARTALAALRQRPDLPFPERDERHLGRGEKPADQHDGQDYDNVPAHFIHFWIPGLGNRDGPRYVRPV